MSLYSKIEHPAITKKSTISKIIKNFFSRNKGVKIGIIDNNTNLDENKNIDDDISAISVQQASPTDIEIQLNSKPKTKPTRRTRTSKKPLSIMGGKYRKSKTRKTRKNIKNKK